MRLGERSLSRLRTRIVSLSNRRWRRRRQDPYYVSPFANNAAARVSRAALRAALLHLAAAPRLSHVVARL
jgi:hypothetical protein